MIYYLGVPRRSRTALWTHYNSDECSGACGTPLNPKGSASASPWESRKKCFTAVCCQVVGVVFPKELNMMLSIFSHISPVWSGINQFNDRRVRALSCHTPTGNNTWMLQWDWVTNKATATGVVQSIRSTAKCSTTSHISFTTVVPSATALNEVSRLISTPFYSLNPGRSYERAVKISAFTKRRT